MADKPSQGNEGSEGIPHSQSPGAPIQFVVVQQNPSDEDGETIGKLIDGLLGGKKEGDDGSTNSSSRKLTVRLSQHNLLVVIALLLLAAGQLVDVVFRYYESKKVKDKESQVLQLDESTLLALRAVVSGTNQLPQQAAWEARQAATAAQDAASAARQSSLTKLDLDWPKVLGALAKPPATIVIPVSSPPSVTPAITVSQTPGVGEHTIPFLPDFEIKSLCFEVASSSDGEVGSIEESPVGHPCILPDWKEKFSKGAAAIVKYKNGRNALELLDFQTFLNADPPIGHLDAADVCTTYPKAGYQPWEAGKIISERVELTLRSSRNRKNAQREWNNGTLYLTLCTTVRLPGSVAVLDRTVYKITVNNNSATLNFDTPFENKTIVLQ